jgi:hypothetical protein
LDIEKLRKIAALMDAPYEGERRAAMERTREMLARAGKTFRDLPELLASRPRQQQSASNTPAPSGGVWRSNIFDGSEIWREERRPRWKAARAREKEEGEQQTELFKAAVLQKYGGKAAALADDERQRAIERAAAPFLWKVPKQYANGIFETETLDGWRPDEIGRSMPQRVAQAVKSALPFPATITDAKIELDYWRERDRELGAMYGNDVDDTCLSLACQAREQLVEEAFETGIRAQSVEEIEMRQRYLVEAEFSMPEIARAVLEDLQYLIRHPNHWHVPFPGPTGKLLPAWAMAAGIMGMIVIPLTAAGFAVSHLFRATRTATPSSAVATAGGYASDAADTMREFTGRPAQPQPFLSKAPIKGEVSCLATAAAKFRARPEFLETLKHSYRAHWNARLHRCLSAEDYVFVGGLHQVDLWDVGRSLLLGQATQGPYNTHYAWIGEGARRQSENDPLALAHFQAALARLMHTPPAGPPKAPRVAPDAPKPGARPQKP